MGLDTVTFLVGATLGPGPAICTKTMPVRSRGLVRIRDSRTGRLGGRSRRIRLSLVLALLASVPSGCGSSNHPTAVPVSVSISPSSASVQVSRSQQFTAAVLGAANTDVNWIIAAIPGGKPSVGTISSTGLYTAPSSVPTNPVTVTAQSAYLSTSSATAIVTILAPPTPVSVSISPTAANVQVSRSQQFTATVSGTTNTSVNWLVGGILGGNSSLGTISSTGLYTAPFNVPANPVTVTAQSAYASTSSANSIVTILPAPTPVSVSISPTIASVQVARTQQFTAKVSGTTNTAVNWLVAGNLGGNSSVGTISSTGVYTAPSNVPANSVAVTAQSASDTSASANATITITSASSLVPENQETAFIWVDPNGSDSNPGTQSQPLKTVQAAVSIAFNNNKNNIGTRVTLNPGTYRGSAQYNAGSGNTSAPVTFQAAANGTVVLSGSDVYTGWMASGNVFTHSWTSLGGTCALPNGWPNMWPIARRREMVFVNDTPLTQVISSNEMVEGTFYVNDAGSQISIWPPSGTDMSTVTVEVAVRPSVFTLAGATEFCLSWLDVRTCRYVPARR